MPGIEDFLSTPLAYATPEQIKAAYAAALDRNRQPTTQQPMHSWLQVAGQIANTAADQMEMRRLLEAQRKGQAEGAAATVPTLPGAPQPEGGAAPAMSEAPPAAYTAPPAQAEGPPPGPTPYIQDAQRKYGDIKLRSEMGGRGQFFGLFKPRTEEAVGADMDRQAREAMEISSAVPRGGMQPPMQPGAMPFADMQQDVGQALKNGQFDPVGGNYTKFEQDPAMQAIYNALKGGNQQVGATGKLPSVAPTAMQSGSNAAAPSAPSPQPQRVAEQRNWAQPQTGTFVDPSMIPARPSITKEKMEQIMASPWIDPAMKTKSMEQYLNQNQLIEMKLGGGTVRINPQDPRRQMWVPELEKSTVKVGGIEQQVVKVIGPDGKMYTLPDAGAGGGGGGSSMGDLQKMDVGHQAEIAGAKERETKLGAAIGENQADYAKSFKPSREAIANIDSMQEAIKSAGPNLSAGPIGPVMNTVKQAITQLTGREVPGTTEAQIVEKGGTMLAIHTAKELTNRPTQFDFKAVLEKANPNLLQTQPAMTYLLNILRQQHVQNVELARMAESTPSAQWPKVRDDFYRAHPLISPLTGKEWTRDTASQDAGVLAKDVRATKQPSPDEIAAEMKRRGLK